MALTPLITAADLSARGINDADPALAADIDSASAAIRDAAGCAITQETSTVRLVTEASRRLELPARPVVSVASVTLDDVPVTDYMLRGSSLWREIAWQAPGAVPSVLTVTFTHGYAATPADIIDLACSLVAGAQAERAAGPRRGVAYERIDDHQIGYIQDAAAERVSAFELPERTVAMLRRRFGSSSVVSGSVR